MKRLEKRSIPVRLGRSKAKIYHFSLIATAWISIVVFLWLNDGGYSKYLVLLSLPLFVFHLLRLSRAKTSTEIDPLLKQLALSTLFLCYSLWFRYYTGLTSAIITLFRHHLKLRFVY